MDLTTPSPPSASAPSAPPASLIDFAALRREREARHGPPPKPGPAGPAPAPPTAVQVHHDPPAKRRALESRAASGPKSGPAVFVGGAVKDGSGRHTLRPAQVPADAYEVDCRKHGTEIKVKANVASFSSGLGSLHDKKPNNAAERKVVMDFLLRDAREIDRELSLGRPVWVHCAQVPYVDALNHALRTMFDGVQGFNRGPSGLLAYLIIYTDATLAEACGLVKEARPQARTRSNTFAAELAELEAEQPKVRRIDASGALVLRDHRTLDIRDGGNDPADDVRR